MCFHLYEVAGGIVGITFRTAGGVPVRQDFGQTAVGVIGVVPSSVVHLGSDQFIGSVVCIGGGHRAGTQILLEFEHVACGVVGVLEGTPVAVGRAGDTLQRIVSIVNGEGGRLL